MRFEIQKSPVGQLGRDLVTESKFDDFFVNLSVKL